jgi:hypothetical protein
MTGSAQGTEENRRAWRQAILPKLAEWALDPESLRTDELIPPTPEALTLTAMLAAIFSDGGAPPPHRVVPNGDGGVTLERWDGTSSEVIEILNGHLYQHRSYSGSELVSSGSYEV